MESFIVVSIAVSLIMVAVLIVVFTKPVCPYCGKSGRIINNLQPHDYYYHIITCAVCSKSWIE